MITKLKETSGDEVRKLLEANNVIILHDTGNRFDIVCPDLGCNQKSAFIDYRGDHRYIKCNRDKNCQYNQGLWELIAEKQSINPSDNTKMLEYINYTIGQDFTSSIRTDTPTYTTFDFENQDTEFLAHCDQIFKNTFKRNNPQTQPTIDYLKTRGYSLKHIEEFNLGFFPDKEELLQALTSSPYSYQEQRATELVSKYFAGILRKNANAPTEEYKYRITFPWWNKHGDISTFSFRQNKSIDPKDKYLFMKGEGLKGISLFNINNRDVNDNRKIVIVEGTFDALAATYLSSEIAKKNYHFVAMGGSSLTRGQAELLHHHRFTDVVLLIDNDEAGEKYKSSVKKLFEYDISVSVARLPQDKDAKDVDELLTKYPDSIDLEIIIESAVKQEMLDKTNNLTQEYKEMAMQDNNRPNSQYHPKMQELLNRIKKDQKASLENKEPLDFIKYNNEIRELKGILLIDNIGLDKRYNPDFIALKCIPSDIEEFNNLLLEKNAEDNIEDEPYTIDLLYEDANKSTDGLKTGFTELDQHISIQPSSLMFVAGRPGHGKTTVMLNMIKNMIKANKDKSFLFCSYEETRQDITIKIILSVALEKLREELQNEAGINLREKVLNQIKKYRRWVKERRYEEIAGMNQTLQEAIDEVDKWIKDGRLQILKLKGNVESVKNSIIKKCIKGIQKENTQVAAVFIDYVQKLSADGGINRQQEVQKVCQILLETVLDKRSGIAIISGSQVNRTVTSFSALNLDSMREAGDIGQDGNILIAVWNERAGKMDSLVSLLAEIEQQTQRARLGLILRPSVKNLESAKETLEKEIEELKKMGTGTYTPFKIKILKNRNGRSDGVFELEAYLERSFVKGKLIKSPEAEETKPSN